MTRRLLVILAIGLFTLGLAAWTISVSTTPPSDDSLPRAVHTRVPTHRMNPDPAPMLQPHVVSLPTAPPAVEAASLTVTLPAVATKAALMGASTTQRALYDAQRQWFETKVLPDSRTYLQGDPQMEATLAWMTDAWRTRRGHFVSDGPEELARRGDSLRAAGMSDPAFLGLLASLHPDFHTASLAFRDAIAVLSYNSEWTPLLLAEFRAASHEIGDTSRPDAQAAAECIADLQRALDKGDCSDDTGAAVFLAVVAKCECLLRPFITTTANSLGNHPRLPPWAQAVLIGQCHVTAAWRARGNGYGNTVTEDGWRIFKERLQLAREAYARAHALAPHRPEPSAKAIVVDMGLGGEDVLTMMRTHLDEATHVCPDFEAAYISFSNALLPRWHGDLDAIAELALTCANSTDYSGYLPFLTQVMVTLIDDDLNMDGKVYQIPQIASALGRVYDGYLNAKDPPLDQRRIRSNAFRAAFIGGDYPRALRLLSAINGPLTEYVAASPQLHNRNLMGICESACGPHGALIAKYLANPAAGIHGELARIVDAAPTDASPGSAWLRHLRSIHQTEARIREKTNAPLPAEAGCPGWKVMHGQWASSATGTYVATPGKKGHFVMHEARVGQQFTFSGKILITASKPGHWRSGVIFGQPPRDFSYGPGWYCVCFRPDRGGLEVALTKGYGQGDEKVAHSSIPGTPPETFSFSVTIDQGKCSVRIDNRAVLSEVPLPDPLPSPNYLGVGGWIAAFPFQVSFSELSITPPDHLSVP